MRRRVAGAGRSVQHQPKFRIVGQNIGTMNVFVFVVHVQNSSSRTQQFADEEILMMSRSARERRLQKVITDLVPSSPYPSQVEGPQTG